MDAQSQQYKLSYDISGWKINEQHHVAAAWRINSDYEHDEAHLFIDGQEVPNLYKYGGPDFTLGDKFGSQGREVIIAAAARPVVGGFDGQTDSNADILTSGLIPFS